MDELASSYHGNFSDSEKKIYREKLFQSISVYVSEHISSIKVDDLSREFHYCKCRRNKTTSSGP